MTHWSDAVAGCEGRGEAYVIVTVVGARGSTPRTSGTKMVVRADGFDGTIGGGELEYRALARARRLLAAGDDAQHFENYPLGEKLGQCCGGSTSLFFECFAPRRPEVYLFGAGHVGRALAPLLASLPLRLTWVDERRDMLPELPEGVRGLADEDPVDALALAPAESYFLIMTHNHPLDYRLAEAALRRDDAAFVGVIGSSAKARRFRLRLAHRGLSPERIAALHCPIGLAGVTGKRPSEIAVAVAAQVIATYQSRDEGSPAVAGPSWKTLQRQLAASGAFGDVSAADSDDHAAQGDPRP